MGCKKQGAKKTELVYSKREEARLPDKLKQWVQIDWATVSILQFRDYEDVQKQ